jgi:hypothetical protein
MDGSLAKNSHCISALVSRTSEQVESPDEHLKRLSPGTCMLPLSD